MAQYIEAKVKYDKVADNGSVKKATDSYLVEADSFALAEAVVTQQVGPMIAGEFTVTAVKKSNLTEIFYQKNAEKVFSEEHRKVTVAFKKKDAELFEKPVNWDATNIDTRWYKVRADFKSIDEKIGSEKSKPVYYLVEGVSVENALDHFEKSMKGTVADYEVRSVAETPILEIYVAAKEQEKV